MTRVRQQILRIATLLIGVSATSVALAVATVDVTYMGPKAKIDGTTIQLVDGAGKPVPFKPVDERRTRFTVDSGTYGVEVYVDGKLVGSRKTITLVEGSNQLRVNSETGEINPPVATLPPAGPLQGVRPAAITFSGGAARLKDRPPTTGVFTVGDTPLLGGASHVTTYGLDANIELVKEEPAEGPDSAWDRFRRTMRFYGCRWNIGGSWSDPTTSIQVPVGTKTGWAYWVPAPNGSTGISSNGGADAQFRTRFSEVHVNWAVPHLIKEEAPWTVTGRPMLGYQHSEFKYDASIVNASIPGVSSTTDQKVQEDDFSAGYGVGSQYMFPNGVWAGAGAGLNAIYYHHRYNGSQDNLCAACAPPTDHYSVSSSDSKSGLTWGASVNAVVGFTIAQNAEIFLLGTYGYHDRSAVVTSKVTPSDDAPHLSTASREFAGIQLGIRVKL